MVKPDQFLANIANAVHNAGPQTAHALLGGVMLLLVLLFPQGLVGTLSALPQSLARRLRRSPA